MSKVFKAVDCFNQGFNCSQSVFSTYCEQFGINPEQALQISCGFGGGMGRQRGTCGAVTGAYMLIGLKHGNTREDDIQSRERTYELVREFADKFSERNKYTSCKELLGIDLLNGDKDAISEKIGAVCPKIVQDASEIIEDLLKIE
jgi:C_GCAxxG_C_C family probable redox protein